jgi:hypothetical protein
MVVSCGLVTALPSAGLDASPFTCAWSSLKATDMARTMVYFVRGSDPHHW